MTRLIVSLYDRPDNARRVVDDLRKAGFDHSQIELLETHPEDRNLFRRVFRAEDRAEALKAEKSMRLLRTMGLPADDADHYARQISTGRSLVVVQSDDEISGRAKQIMSRYPVEETDVENSYGDHDVALHPDSPEDTREPPPHTYGTRSVEIIHPSSEEPELSSDEPGAHNTTDADVIETSPEKSDTERGLREERFRHTDEKSPSPPRLPSGFDVLADREGDAQFGLHIPEFRRHYEEHFAVFGEYSWEDFRRAYRYGMDLARVDEHRHRLWPDIEADAGRHWEEHMALPWPKFREAARYGWYQIRGDAELYGGRPGSLR